MTTSQNQTPPGAGVDLRKGGLSKEQRQNMREGNLAPKVFWPAAAIMVLFVGLTTAFPQRAKSIFDALQTDVINYFGWYYVAIVAFFVVFALYLGFSRMGDIKLGDDDDEPAYTFTTWFAFLFAAGMGIGLVFYGATEPLMHYVDPRPGVEGGSREQIAQSAMSQSFLHWGLHPWAIYVIVGLAIAYSAHRLKQPLSIRYSLKPLLGDRVTGNWGNLIDIVALVGTLFGVATSLGLGVMQIAAGLGYLNIPAEGNLWLIGIILVLMGITLFSVVTGLEKGMKWLSNGNLILAAIVCIFVLLVGPTLFLFREFIGSLGHYLQNIVAMTFETLALYGVDGEQFQAAWTTFYWGWWISWSPFVGMFIARVSKGRSVREFVTGVLLVPALTSFFWFSVLGGTALHQELFSGESLRNADGSVSAEHALFEMFSNLPGGVVLTVGAVLLITIFFVTSADSGALVLGMLSTNGSPEPKTWIRVFWVCVAAVTSIALIIVGGSDALSAIQTIAILTALPFSVVIILMCISLYKALSVEHRLFVRAQRRNAREELMDSVADRVDEHLDSHFDAALDKAVEAKVEEAVEEAVEKAVDEVNVQISANTAAINQIRTATGAIPVVTPKTQEKPWDK
ncbi:BCCT family transporter [Rothia sp. (in: high G+C Gram-positive bacteria)]|uniref:BCCT family transporter n=1 Tax=Rothia sp. (in: high G+C Gram-positive bacteria) TaxID=1885016 RepID=UPI000EDA286C|nr:choline transporter [Rothia sp. (in: high G+C Gram-positive bacteria)]